MSSRSRVIRNSIVAIAAIVLVAALVMAVAVVVVVRRPLPSYDGETAVGGLTAEVTVTRDGRGIPQILARDANDLFQMQGYLHAQDRFFQMDYARHVASGRLAELVGDNYGAIESDKLVRTMGWPQIADQEWELLSPPTRAYLQAYADGVNEFLGQRSPGDVSVGYIVNAGVINSESPAKWEPADSLLLLKAMAWEQTGNVSDEVARASILRSVGDPARVEELYPVFDYSKITPVIDQEIPVSDDTEPRTETAPVDAPSEPSTLSEETPTDPNAGSVPIRPITGKSPSDSDVLRGVASVFGATPTSGGNAWVVSGELTKSGKPMLATDPHQRPSVPGPWYQNGLRCAEINSSCPFDVSGATLVGIPGVLQGHNSSLAWSLTAGASDTADLFLEKLRDTAYLYDDVLRTLTFREETIAVAEGDDVVISVRSTEHGPLITDLDPDLGGSLTEAVNLLAPGTTGGELSAALSWTGLTPGTTAEAIFDLDRAQSAQDLSAMSQKFSAPAMDLLYASSEGNIGHLSVGHVPQRTLLPGALVPAQGTWPRIGWDSQYDWSGTVTADDMPAIADPESGIIVAANQATTPVGVGPFLGQNWDQGYRSNAIRAHLATAKDKSDKLTVAKMSRIQTDAHGSFANTLIPSLLAVSDTDEFTKEAVELLRGWDFTQEANSAAGAYYAAIWSNLLRLTFADEISKPFRPDGDDRWMAVVQRLLDDPNNSWWDDKTTVSVVETRDEILHQSLIQARLELTTKLGKDPESWQWGRIHTLNLAQQPMGTTDVPFLENYLLNPSPIAINGAESSINTAGWDASERYNYQADFVPSMRMVVDLGNLDNSRWVNLPGISGHPGSPYYTDQITAWSEGTTFPWPYSKDEVAAGAVNTMVFKPSGAS